MNKQEKIAELKRKIKELENEPDEEVFSKRLREILAQRNMKQIELSELTYVSRQTIWNYVAGKMMPSAIHAIRIADTLGIDIHYLLGFTDKY